MQSGQLRYTINPRPEGETNEEVTSPETSPENPQARQMPAPSAPEGLPHSISMQQVPQQVIIVQSNYENSAGVYYASGNDGCCYCPTNHNTCCCMMIDFHPHNHTSSLCINSSLDMQGGAGSCNCGKCDDPRAAFCIAAGALATAGLIAFSDSFVHARNQAREQNSCWPYIKLGAYTGAGAVGVVYLAGPSIAATTLTPVQAAAVKGLVGIGGGGLASLFARCFCVGNSVSQNPNALFPSQRMNPAPAPEVATMDTPYNRMN